MDWLLVFGIALLLNVPLALSEYQRLRELKRQRDEQIRAIREARRR